MQLIEIDLIKPYLNNAKKHPTKQIKQIANSIKEFGFNQPIVIDKKNEIIVGHGRYLAARELGLKTVPFVRLENLSKEQVKAYRLADNKLNESEWDLKMVIDELKELDLKGFNIDLTGFDKDLLIDSDAKDDVIPENVPTVVKLDDVWQLGRHRVMCGDSTQPDAVATLMGGALADMIFTDPPYNVDYHGMQNSKQWNGIANDKMSDARFEEFLKKIFGIYNENSKGESALYICHADKSHREFRKAFEEAGYAWRATIIWVKNSPAFNFAQYKYAHEPIFYCFKKGKIVNWYGDLTRKTVWHEEWDINKIVNWYKHQIKLDKEQAKTTIWEAKKELGDHPTIKPVELITKAITNSSKEDDLITDYFLGSGSTLIAAEKTNRICYGMEIDPKYCDVIIKRWENFTGKKAKKVA